MRISVLNTDLRNRSVNTYLFQSWQKKIQFTAQLVLGGNVDLTAIDQTIFMNFTPVDQRAVGDARNAVVGDESGDPRAR